LPPGEARVRQLTARQRHAARIFLGAVFLAALGGAAFGHIEAPQTGLEGALRGGATGMLIAALAVSLELSIFSQAHGGSSRRWPFLVYLGLRSLAYLIVILIGLALAAWLSRTAADQPLIDRTAVIFSFGMSIGFNLLYGISGLLGQGTLLNFIAGRYHRPRIEERVLLFIDMEGSTAIAENLGETRFLDFLNRFIGDVTDPIVAWHGSIHKYVGDEIIVTWPLAAGIKDAACVRACFDALAALDRREAVYLRDFGRRTNFRGALHCGPVAIGELGGFAKVEIALLGDTMNTAARIQQACRDTGHRVLASASVMDRLAILPVGIAKEAIGKLNLRGKEEAVELYALGIAGAAQQPAALRALWKHNMV
jgi:adenylate cyclase